MIAADTETRERLIRIEERIAHIEQVIQSFHDKVVPVIENPGRLMAKLMGGPR